MGSLATLGVTVQLFAGCANVDSRIARNREAFSTWPPAVQDKVVVRQINNVRVVFAPTGRASALEVAPPR